MKKSSFLLAFLLCASAAFAQNITRKGDTLIATPAKTYQWLKNGTAINGATNQKYIPTEKGNYTVRLGDISENFRYINNYRIITGIVYDIGLNPIANADVFVNGTPGKTNELGRYTIRFALSERTTIKVNHPEYQKRSIGLATTRGEVFYKNIFIEKFTPTHTWTGTKAIALSMNNFILKFPDSAIVDVKSGKVYTGKISTQLIALTPGDPLFGDRMPGGDFLGIRSNGNEEVLYSFGFFSCQMKGENNESLNIAPNKKIQVTFQPKGFQHKKMKEQVPVWYFDEETAYWKEEGVCKKNDRFYTADISHFSSWNCDWSGPRSWVEGEVINCDTTTASPPVIYIDQIPVVVDNIGNYRQWVPANWDVDLYSDDVIKVQIPGIKMDSTYHAPKIQSSGIIANLVFDNSNKMTIVAVGGKGKLSYSADNGKNFQSSNQFIVYTNDTSTKYCIIRDETNCEFRLSGSRNSFSVIPCNLVFPYDTMYYKGNYLSTVKANAYKSLFQNGELSSGLKIENETDAKNFLIGYPYSQCINKLLINNVKESTDTLMKKVAGMNNLQLLQILSCDFKVYPNTLSNLSNLKFLQIGFYNNFTKIPDSFMQLTELEKFGFYSTSITNVPAGISELKKLRLFELSSSKLIAFPVSVLNVPTLTELILSSNKIPTIPKEIQQLKNLQLLGMSFNSLTQLPDEITTLTELKRLVLYNNNLTSLPLAIGDLTNLEMLPLYWNQLTQLPESIGNLDKVQELLVYNNKLTSLPKSIGDMKVLRKIEAYDNNLTTLPAELSKCDSLTWINVSGNKISSLSKEIGDLKKIRVIDLRNNQLTSLPPEISKLNDRLESLYLTGNPISPEERTKIKSWLPKTTITW